MPQRIPVTKKFIVRLPAFGSVRGVMLVARVTLAREQEFAKEVDSPAPVVEPGIIEPAKVDRFRKLVKRLLRR